MIRFPLLCALLAGCLMLAAPAAVRAQQDYQFTQFAFNKLALNPAYGGTDNLISLTSLYRRQWSGLEGAPQTITLAGHAPVFHNRIGLGLLVYNDRIGVTSDLGVYTTYSYKVPLGGSVLSLGLQAGFQNYRTSLTELNPLTSGDAAFAQDLNSIHPNAGFGIYWYRPGRAYAGLSVPRLLESKLDDLAPEAPENSLLTRHSYLMGGYVFPVNRNLKLRPAGLLKFAGPGQQSAPLSAEINLSALLAERIWLGAAWRSSDAVGAMAEFQISDQLMLGYAYDFGISALSDVHGGSHEVMLRLELIADKNAAVTPRKIKYF
jgi:type IX secretion system PorP/SprF family membrane protein